MAAVIVATFPTQTALKRALNYLVESKAVIIKRAAVVAKAASGETIVLDDDLSMAEGGAAGGTIGAAMAALGMVQLGALALPGIGTVIALGAGALVGGVLGNVTGRFAANLLDFGFQNEQIEALSAQLREGHPALILETEASMKETLERLRKELKPYQAELIEPLQVASQKQPPASTA